MKEDSNLLLENISKCLITDNNVPSSVNNISNNNLFDYSQAFKSEYVNNALKNDAVQRTVCPYAQAVSSCSKYAIGKMKNTINQCEFSSQDYSKARAKFLHDIQHCKYAEQNDVSASEWAARFNGISRCPLSITEEADVAQFKSMFLESIRHLHTEEEISAWNSVPKRWEDNRCGPYGYYYSSAQDSNYAPKKYSISEAVDAYHRDSNILAIEAFKQQQLDSLSDDELFMYLCCLASENCNSDIFDALKYFRTINDHLQAKKSILQVFHCVIERRYSDAINELQMHILSVEEDISRSICQNLMATLYFLIGDVENAVKYQETAHNSNPKSTRFAKNWLFLQCRLSEKN